MLGSGLRVEYSSQGNHEDRHSCKLMMSHQPIYRLHLRSTGALYPLTHNRVNVRQQAPHLLLDRLITLARRSFELLAIDDCDEPSSMLDQSPPLQMRDDEGHGGTPNAKHGRKELVGHRELIAAGSVARHQQPTAASLLSRV